MSTNFDPAFVQNLTGLNPNPIIRLLELTVEDTPVLERLADSNQDVLFHGITFQRFGMTIDGLDPGSVEDPERVTIVVQNIDGVVHLALRELLGREPRPGLVAQGLVCRRNESQPDRDR